jgi:asparaginyl-tRNA synthetase
MAAEKVTIGELAEHVGQEITLAGWLYNSRASGKIQFLIVRDGTGLCQCVVEKGNVSDEVFEDLKHLGQESSLTVTGAVRTEERSVGGHELAVTGAEVMSPATPAPSLATAVVHRQGPPHRHRRHPQVLQRQRLYAD